MNKRMPLDLQAVRQSTIPLTVVLSMADTATPLRVSHFDSDGDLREALVAACWLPIARPRFSEVPWPACAGRWPADPRFGVGGAGGRVQPRALPADTATKPAISRQPTGPRAMACYSTDWPLAWVRPTSGRGRARRCQHEIRRRCSGSTGGQAQGLAATRFGRRGCCTGTRCICAGC